MRKLLLILATTLGAVNIAQAAKLHNYDEAADLIRQGKLITFAVDLDRCTPKDPSTPKLNIFYTWRPEGIRIQQGVILARGTTYSETITSVPNANKSLQAYEYRLDKTNTLTTSAHLLDPATYSDRAKPREFTCQLNEGFNMYS